MAKLGNQRHKKISAKRQESISSSGCLKIRRTILLLSGLLSARCMYVHVHTCIFHAQTADTSRRKMSRFDLPSCNSKGAEWGGRDGDVNNSGGAARPAKLSILLANIKTFSHDGDSERGPRARTSVPRWNMRFTEYVPRTHCTIAPGENGNRGGREGGRVSGAGRGSRGSHWYVSPGYWRRSSSNKA